MLLVKAASGRTVSMSMEGTGSFIGVDKSLVVNEALEEDGSRHQSATTLVSHHSDSLDTCTSLIIRTGLEGDDALIWALRGIPHFETLKYCDRLGASRLSQDLWSAEEALFEGARFDLVWCICKKLARKDSCSKTRVYVPEL